MSQFPIALRFETHDITIIRDANGEPWWVADEVCKVLGIDKHRDAVARLDDDERGSVVVDTPGGPQRKATINESGLYSLILRSRKTDAKRFKRWVTHEVLPSIRKTGGYGTDTKLDERLDRMEKAISRIGGQVHASERADLEAEVLKMSTRIGLARVTTLAHHLRSFMRPHVAFQLIEQLVDEGKLVMVVAKSSGPQLVGLPWRKRQDELALVKGGA